MSSDSPNYVECELVDDAAVFRVLVRELRDPETSYAVRDEMLAQLTQTPTRKVVIDLGDVKFIGSIGFLAFLNTRRHVVDGRIVLCNVSPSIVEAFQACRLVSADDTHPAPFEVQATRAEAIASLAS